VVFSDQQKETIKQFMATGQVAKAQEVILKELNTEFGGLATAMAKTDDGKLKMASKALTEMKTTVGKLISEGLAKLSPLVVGIGNLFHKTFGQELSQDLEESRGKMEDLFETLKTGNLSLDERKDIIEELNSQYGPYLKGLITEKMTSEDLADAEKYANDQMLKKIEIEVRQEAIKKVMEAYKKEESRHLEAEKEVRKSERLAKEGEKAAEKSDDDQVREYYTKSAYEALKWSKMKLSESEKKMADSKKALDDEINDLGGNSINKDLKKRSLADIKKEIDTLLGKDKTDKIGKGGADAQSAFNTSALGGASGGLGEAKVIKIDFHKALMEVNVPGGNGTDIIGKGQLTVEAMLRIINNLSMAQGATM
jgi:hypothetical protein